MSGGVPSRYGGKCSSCGEWFPEGTLIEQTEGQWHHVACPEPVDDYDVRYGICSTCFLTVSANGKCGCEP